MDAKCSHNAIKVSEADGYIFFIILDAANRVSFASYDISYLNSPRSLTGMIEN